MRTALTRLVVVFTAIAAVFVVVAGTASAETRGHYDPADGVDVSVVALLGLDLGLLVDLDADLDLEADVDLDANVDLQIGVDAEVDADVDANATLNADVNGIEYSSGAGPRSNG